jgi:alpha-1,3-rhamnosyl/mannosyltransferase
LSYYQGKETLHNICKKHDTSCDSVKILEYIPDSELASLISKSRASIFPPYLEGLGLPILESYAAGTPCFTANTSSTKEFADKESLFNPFDINDIADAFAKIYTDDALCKRNLEYGKKILKGLSAENIIRKILNKLHE